MVALRDVSIRQKLLAIILLTSGIALLLACLTFAAYDYFSTRDSLTRRLSTMADVVGANSTAALTFDNPTDADETLSALRAEPHIIAGVVFDREDQVFAAYAPRGEFTIPPLPAELDYRFGDEALEVFRPIFLEGERVGTIYLRANLVELDERMTRYAQIAFVFLCVASLVTLLVGTRLRNLISEPILRLLATMQTVRDEQSYSVRADKHADDELGHLVDGFNTMLSQIEERDDALRTSLREKEVLLKEVHHRVKNNLQIIASLLDLQARNVDDPSFSVMLQDSRNRVRSMGLIHEHLYGTEELARIDLPDYIQDLCRTLASSYAEGARQVEVEVADVAFDIDSAIPCGLVINELVSNAFKYAFPDGGGHVTVRLGEVDGGYELVVADDGVGLPADIDPTNSPSLGLQLVSALVGQLRGELSYERNGGTTVRVRFKGHLGSS